MQPDLFEDQMREFEYYHSLRVVPGVWVVLRVDGRGFSRFTESRFEKPFDPRMREMMVATARALLEDLQGVYAYTESDEISVLFPPAWDLFDRELEKVVSVSASIAGATFTHACGEPAHFDSRVWLGVTDQRVVDYFRWRQADAARCALHGWCYWTLRRDGLGGRQAMAQLSGKDVAFLNELLFQRGINFNDVPAWQRRGTGLYQETYEKEGFDPKQGKTVVATRRRVKVDEDLPMKDEYSRLLREVMASAVTPQPKE